MPVNVALIAQPSIDFNTLLGITHEALGRNIAANADNAHRKVSPSEKFVMCMASMTSQDQITANLLSHVSFTILIIIDDYSVLDIINVASGMSFISTDSDVSGCSLVVMTGTLAQWRDAVASGTSRSAINAVRNCYSKILVLFDQLGLSNVWRDYDRSSDRQGYYLEYNNV
jgi:hypothetical protein